jgi:lambda family phage portal protein
MALRNRLADAFGRMARRLDPAPASPKRRADAGGWSGNWDTTGVSSTHPLTGYEGASLGHRMSKWQPTRAHINSLLSTEGPLLRARSRSLIANAPYAQNASDTFAAYAAGSGIKPSSLIDDHNKADEIEQLFTDWTDEADADGLTDFYGLQSLIARAVFDAGEVFVRLRPRLMSDGLTVPLQLQLLESEQLDTLHSEILQGGNLIRGGIEFDQIGRRVAYWFWRYHPGDSTMLVNTAEKVRVPAASVLHIYRPLRPGQIRGRPWMTAAIIKLYDLDQYDDAELMRKKLAALFSGYLTKGLNTDAQMPIPEDARSLEDPAMADYEMEPGIIHALPEGFDIKFSGPADVGSNYEAFQLRALYQLCAALGLPYHAVTGDVSKANYSSLRASLVEVRRRIEQFQWETLIYQFCRPVWNSWLQGAVLSGAVSLPGFARDQRVMSRVKWIPPKWDWVDPLKDMQAEKLAVDSGFKARSDVVESTGEDAARTDERIAADHAREKELGLEFPAGFTKNVDRPAGTDIAPTGGDVTQGMNPGQPDQGDRGVAAEDDQLMTLLRTVIPQSSRTVVTEMMPQATRTVVTETDEKGRIKSFERHPIRPGDK